VDFSSLSESKAAYFESLRAELWRLEHAERVCAALELQPNDAGMRFVPQSELPVGEAYEAFIARTQCVPTRENWHDLLNGLVWHRFPESKRVLNRIQAAEIARAGTSARTPLRDAATVFDENAALLISPPPQLLEALQARDWNALFLTHRALWQGTQLLLFGHALMEKLLNPFKAITAHVLVLPNAEDEALAQALPQALQAKAFLPLPVMGVPGFCEANESPEFYADAAVFRPPTMARQSKLG
jgi:hypothetical protein